MAEESCLIDGFGPVPVGRPGSVTDLAEMVRQAGREGQGIYPLGGRTMLELGHPPNRPGVALDLRGLDQVIDYPARDMTITVGAGLTVKRLQEILAPENQRLPIDVPRAETATLGGILAANVSGSRRYGHGTLRDYLLGFSAICGQGQEIKAGGRVVKNVAGYDLCKLFIGSLGTLGILTQVTLKLRPRAENQALLAISLVPEKMEAVLDLLHRTRTRPVALELLNQSAAQCLHRQGNLPEVEGPWLALVGFEANAESVRWQVQQLLRELGNDFPVEARVGSVSDSLWKGLAEFPLEPTTALSFKANLLPSGIAAFCQAVDRWPERLLIQAHAGNGIVLGHFPTETEPGRALDCVATLRKALAPSGQLVVTRCLSAWKQNLDVWGPPGGDAKLMRAIKEKLDPGRNFNPGRFFFDR